MEEETPLSEEELREMEEEREAERKLREEREGLTAGAAEEEQDTSKMTEVQGEGLEPAAENPNPNLHPRPNLANPNPNPNPNPNLNPNLNPNPNRNRNPIQPSPSTGLLEPCPSEHGRRPVPHPQQHGQLPGAMARALPRATATVRLVSHTLTSRSN